jgi:N-acetyl-1-D-myo-inositol-2-amino-2-deoxy-alpha-D-glucopyranoside deacetylase
VPDEQVTTVVDVAGVLDAKRAALAAHATQVVVAPGGAQFALSNLVAQPVLEQEHYVLVRGDRGDVDGSGRERDLFAGLS